jgi:hypothetical protein
MSYIALDNLLPYPSAGKAARIIRSRMYIEPGTNRLFFTFIHRETRFHRQSEIRFFNSNCLKHLIKDDNPVLGQKVVYSMLLPKHPKQWVA